MILGTPLVKELPWQHACPAFMQDDERGGLCSTYARSSSFCNRQQQELCGAQYRAGMTVRFFVAVSFASSSSAAAVASSSASALRRFSLALRVFGNCCVFVVVEVTLFWFLLYIQSVAAELRNKNTTDLLSLLL